MSKYHATDFGNCKEILMHSPFTAVSVLVDAAEGITEGNKKVVKAGTIMGGSALPVLLNENEPVVKKNHSGAEGVLLYDVDVTFGSNTGALVLEGYVNLAQLPEEPTPEAIAALKKITFMK